VTEPVLKGQIQRAMTEAMKSGDKVATGALRMFLAAIKNKEVEGDKARELSDDEVGEVAGKEVKKRTESIEAFDATGRTELADKERAERDVVAPYAPAQLSDDAVDTLVDEALAATGATTAKELGKVMGYVMGKAKGQVDGGIVQRKVREKLSD